MPPGNKSMLRASRNLHHPRRLPGAPGSVLVASSVRVMNMALAASSTTLISSLMRNVLGLSGSRLRYADAIRALSSLSHWSHRVGMCLVSTSLAVDPQQVAALGLRAVAAVAPIAPYTHGHCQCRWPCWAYSVAGSNLRRVHSRTGRLTPRYD